MDVEKISDWFRTDYKDTVDMLLEQTKSVLEPYVTQGTYKGQNAVVAKHLGEVDFREVTTIFGDTEYGEIEHTQRWLNYKTYARAYPISKLNILSMFDGDQSLISQYQQKMVYDFKRKTDELIIAAALGNAYAGKNYGDETIPLPAGIAAGAAGLTKAKVEKVIETLLASDADLDTDQLILVISPKQQTDLRNIDAFISRDYKEDASMNNPYIGNLYGMNVLLSNKLPKVSTTRTCFAYMKSGLHLGYWKNLELKATELPTKNYDWQVYGSFAMNATRLQEEKVIKIDCVE
jgi:hypothetical protein